MHQGRKRPGEDWRLAGPGAARGHLSRRVLGAARLDSREVIDLKAARQDPDRYRAALARRGAAKDFDALLAADASWRVHTERAEALRAAQKSLVQGQAGTRRDRAAARTRRRVGRRRQSRAGAGRPASGTICSPGSRTCPIATAADGMDEEDAQLVRDLGRAAEVRLRAARHARRSALGPRLDRHGQGGAAVRLPVRLPDRRRRAGRDGAVPVRHRQADRPGFPARAAADPGRRAVPCTAPASCRPRSPTSTTWRRTTST